MINIISAIHGIYDICNLYVSLKWIRFKLEIFKLLLTTTKFYIEEL